MTENEPFLRPGERLLLVSNRLPVTLERTAEGTRARLSSGGLATGLSRPHREGGGPWIGWPGLISPNGTFDSDVENALEAQGMVGIPLDPEEHSAYYTWSSNRCLWPLFHYFPDWVRFSWEAWEVYEAVNRKFADAVLEHAREGDLVFIQDFHLMLVPAMLREARPDLRIGFFLHIPFPSTELLRLLPARRRVLEGLLGADFIAFHTLDYVRHFRSALTRLLGLEPQPNHVLYQERKIRLQAQPLGIDAQSWAQMASPATQDPEFQALLRAVEGRKIILGVDRLDYTKGIPDRLKAFGEFLRADPRRSEQVTMIQIAVPSRVEVDEYRALKDEVDRIAGQINSEHGRLGHQPLHYLFRSVSKEVLVELYRLADVALVTPLRDGLNLVAKEFVASKKDDSGVLVLAETVGAASELGEALQVNPFDRRSLTEALECALAMSPAEQAERMQAMRDRVQRNDVHLWAKECVQGIRAAREEVAPPVFTTEAEAEWCRPWIESSERWVFLDYDGSLQEFTHHPEQADPDPEVLQLLERFAIAPGVHPWIVSGRPQEVLANWFGGTGVGLVAEHGAFIRNPDADTFESTLTEPSNDWRVEVGRVMRQFTDRVPGSLIEEKPLGMSWHFRAADPTLSVWQSRELQMNLRELLAGTAMEVTTGNKVIEVRHAGIDKGHAILSLLDRATEGAMIFAAGDDFTDEDTFRRLPQALTLLVGHRASAARFRIPDPTALRALLNRWAGHLEHDIQRPTRLQPSYS